MIGQLINKFDNLEENCSNLKTFNKMFKTELSGNDTSLVEIGSIVTGGLREVFINGKMNRIQMVEIKNLDHIIDDNFTVYQVVIDGQIKGLYNSFRAIAEALEVCPNTVRDYTDKEYSYYGYKITSLKTNEETYNCSINEGVIKLPIDKNRRRKTNEGRPNLYEYTVELSSGEKKTFSSTEKCGKFVGATRKAIDYRIKKASGKMLKGYSVIKTKIGA